jgi:hypothetical protein
MVALQGKNSGETMIPALSCGYTRPIQKNISVKKQLVFGNTVAPHGNSATIVLLNSLTMSRAEAEKLWGFIHSLWWSDVTTKGTGKKAILELWEYSKAVRSGESPPEISTASRHLLRTARILESAQPPQMLQGFILACISMVSHPGIDGDKGFDAPSLTGPFI